MTINSLHDQEGRHGTEYGHVYIQRKGQVLCDSQGIPKPVNPEAVQRGDIILDHQLRPLRNRTQKGIRNGRRD